MTDTRKEATFGGSVDISSRQSGSYDALKDLGMTAGPALDTELKALDKTRLGTKTEKAPKLRTVPAHEYTTSGALLNPKVALYKQAAEGDAPNYGHASSDATSCTHCRAYHKQDKVMGHCTKYDFYANGKYTCDNWTAQTRPSPSHFIRTKLR